MWVYTGETGSIRYWYRIDPVRNPAVCDCSINMRSVFRECSHTQTDFEPGQHRIKTYRPGSTRIDPHRNPCQFLMDSESTMRRRKKFWSCSKFLHGFRFRSGIRIYPVLTALIRINPQCKTALTLVVYCIVLHAMACIRVGRGQKGFKTDFYTV
jgi:hypothetical protein